MYMYMIEGSHWKKSTRKKTKYSHFLFKTINNKNIFQYEIKYTIAIKEYIKRKIVRLGWTTLKNGNGFWGWKTQGETKPRLTRGEENFLASLLKGHVLILDTLKYRYFKVFRYIYYSKMYQYIVFHIRVCSIDIYYRSFDTYLVLFFFI